MGRYTASGKQVLRDGAHFADCATEQAAQIVLTALTAMRTGEPGPLVLPRLRPDTLSPGTYVTVEGIRGGFEIGEDYNWEPIPNGEPVIVRGTTHSISQQFDEYACSCGMRWDVADGDEHP